MAGSSGLTARDAIRLPLKVALRGDDDHGVRQTFLWVRVGVGGLVVALTAASGTIALGRQSASAESTLRHAAVAAHPAPQLHPFAPQPPPLPVPAPTPGNAFTSRAVDAIGEIAMPTIGVQLTLFEGVDQAALAQGPGHWPGTAAPGGWGNTVIAAHRSSHGSPFHDIDQLEPGDAIVLRNASGTFTYSVAGEQVVTPTDMWIVDQHPGRMLTLFTCHPIGGSSQRYVVTATLVSAESAAAAA